MVGKQKIKDDGALTKKRMETYDEETLQYSLKFIDKAVKDDKPFFVWHNATRMHVFTHLSKKYMDMVPEKGFYGAGMTEFDDDIGVLLKQLDDLGIADNTIVIISTDNGAEVFTWPDGGTTPFRGEKATTWEGGFRVPAVVRWPGVIKPGTVINDIFSHLDWMPTFMAAVGEPDIKEKLLKGHEADGKKFKVHLDGYDQTALLKGEGPGARKEIFYITDDGDLSAFRYDKWKVLFTQQKSTGMDVWREPLSPTRMPILVDLHADPFEAAVSRGHSYEYDKWAAERMFVFVPAQDHRGGVPWNLQGVSAKAKAVQLQRWRRPRTTANSHAGQISLRSNPVGGRSERGAQLRLHTRRTKLGMASREQLIVNFARLGITILTVLCRDPLRCTGASCLRGTTGRRRMRSWTSLRPSRTRRERTTSEPADRVATFDNDGTLWVEYPMYTQALFAFDRVKGLAPQHPEWVAMRISCSPFKGVPGRRHEGRYGVFQAPP